MTDQPDDEHFSEWLFYRRKHRQRRVAHTTRTISTNTKESNK